LDGHAAGAGPPLVVLGESGGGKSALLANWASACANAATAPFAIEHYIGATPASTDWAAMLRRILSELDRHFALEVGDSGQARSPARGLCQRALPCGRRKGAWCWCSTD